MLTKEHIILQPMKTKNIMQMKTMSKPKFRTNKSVAENNSVKMAVPVKEKRKI